MSMPRKTFGNHEVWMSISHDVKVVKADRINLHP